MASSAAGRQWEFWVDRGGTFTDVIGIDPRGNLRLAKLLSSNQGGEDAAVAGIRNLLGVKPGAKVPPRLVKIVRMGTTVATNALLERRGAKVAFLTTKGFGDALRIRNQNRPDLFALFPRRPKPLYAKVVEVDERTLADGTVERAPDLQALRKRLRTLLAAGIDTVAISLLHSHRYPEHERKVSSLCKEVGMRWVFASSATEPVIGAVARGETTVADAYLTPLLRRYVDDVASQLGDVPLQFMQSNGGLVAAGLFTGRNAVLSGPAGGIIGAVSVAVAAGRKRLVSFDMGGTSTDVAHWDGGLERSTSTEVAGISLRTPMLRVHTVAAGGGSVCSAGMGRLQVGPDSAGADPGPACYGRKGPLAVTDCNMVLGRLLPDAMPKVFGPKQDCPPSPRASRARLAQTARKLGRSEKDLERLAADFVDVANEHMAKAIKAISVQRGHDLERDYALVSFGGAGGQHACQLASSLGISTVLVHPLAGLLSAAGLGTAAVRAVRQRSLEMPLAGNLVRARKELATLERDARAEIRAAKASRSGGQSQLRVLLRYAGSSASFAVPLGSAAAMRRGLAREHRQAFGFGRGRREVVIAGVEAEVATANGKVGDHFRTRPGKLPSPLRVSQLYENGSWVSARAFARKDLRAGNKIAGPALVVEDTATTYVPGDWVATMDRRGTLAIKRVKAKRHAPRASEKRRVAKVDPGRLEVFHSVFMSVAEQMGHVLKNTASSVNIKERLDFSCAVFDARGDLVANAPHIPVHLGSMDTTVREVLRANRGKMRPGDAWLVNVPYAGGTHLPDLTVVSPVFVGKGKEPSFFTCSRGHHADIGGITPGSMPADSTSLDQEGVRFDNFHLVRGGRLAERELLEALRQGPHPARDPKQNLADLSAQLAANAKGERELRKACLDHGAAVVREFMRNIQDNAAAAVRELLGKLRPGEFKVSMDDGEQVAVSVTLDAARRNARVDFAGTSAQHPGNLNAPPAVVRAAVCYVLRCMLDERIPLNAGMMRPIALRVPRGSMLNPRRDAAVAAGNVEVSQAVVDCLLGALKVAAASQGTMNNIAFGNASHQYYETVCGGAGAGKGHTGESAIHTHMTNTLITDPEVLEERLPVVLERFAIRKGSGGQGRWRGGDGVVRTIRFIKSMDLTILSNRRKVPPYGMAGGKPGKRGSNWVRRATGKRVPGGGRAQFRVEAGDTLELRTPGGGGWGKR